ncbi:four helix bundle protein [Lewinella aquimaris]|uniref:Four helix bundle protein n=1 Tax=Neolewinella aquimaris TaxID=1835722 RepID=A0A840E7C0_9BACT|nr:four helix bundle protein [Neolewinella aquimaris]MBB4077699.1 four helix bundle protein [Neolewinella aquimaris]
MDDFEEIRSLLMEPAKEYGEGRTSSREFAIELKRRTKEAAIRLVNFMERTGKSPALSVVRYQLLKSGTSVAANYRAACRARSKKEWYAKMCIVVEECDETVFWLEVLMESEIRVNETEVRVLGKEYQTLLQIFAKARATAKV